MEPHLVPNPLMLSSAADSAPTGDSLGRWPPAVASCRVARPTASDWLQHAGLHASLPVGSADEHSTAARACGPPQLLLAQLRPKFGCSPGGATFPSACRIAHSSVDRQDETKPDALWQPLSHAVLT